MIKLGTSNITSIYKGTEEIVKAYKGLDLIFNKTTPTPPIEVNYADDLYIDYRGEDNYVNGAWTSRINTASKTFTFTPVSTSTAPVYDSVNKLYEATSYGGMVGNWATDSVFSFEVTLRDVKNVSSNSSTMASIIGPSASGGQSNGIAIHKNSSTNLLWLTTRNSSGGSVSGVSIDCSTLSDNGLDTFAIIPGVGFFHNGIKIGDCSTNVTVGKLGIFTHIDSSTYRSKGKIHALRYWKRKLTAEEVLQNYQTDISIYGE